MLEVKNLSKTYKTSELFKTKVFKALDNINFSLKQGEFLSIIGSSGSGKTTLGRIIGRILEFESGTVKYFDKDINEYSNIELSTIVQMIFQNPYASFNPKLKIRTSFMEAFTDKNNPNKEETIEKTLKSVGLETKILDNYPHQFSGGQRQRIAIARVLLKKPKLIIADEPFASLDMFSQKQIMDIFENIKRDTDMSIILITHDISAAMKFSERMMIIEEGKIVKDDKVENILKEKENDYINELIYALEV